MVESCTPIGSRYWEVVAPLRVGSSGGSQGHWEHEVILAQALGSSPAAPGVVARGLL